MRWVQSVVLLEELCVFVARVRVLRVTERLLLGRARAARSKWPVRALSRGLVAEADVNMSLHFHVHVRLTKPRWWRHCARCRSSHVRLYGLTLKLVITLPPRASGDSDDICCKKRSK